VRSMRVMEGLQSEDGDVFRMCFRFVEKIRLPHAVIAVRKHSVRMRLDNYDTKMKRLCGKLGSTASECPYGSLHLNDKI